LKDFKKRSSLILACVRMPLLLRFSSSCIFFNFFCSSLYAFLKPFEPSNSMEFGFSTAFVFFKTIALISPFSFAPELLSICAEICVVKKIQKIKKKLNLLVSFLGVLLKTFNQI
jgi:hypothetical protein